MSAAIDRLRQWLAVPPQSAGDGVWVDRADLRALLADYDVERVEREREWTKGRAAEADATALRRELDALRQTHTGDLARERERVEAAERECERRGAELARVRAAVRMHESAREQMDAHDRATLRSLAGDSRAVLIEELAGARRERDDWNARATSLEFERDAAIADAAGLRAIVDVMRDALDSVRATMTTDPREWAAQKRDAWAYGVLVGWGGALPIVAAQHGWPAADVDRLRRYAAAVCAARAVAAAEVATGRAGEGGEGDSTKGPTT